jgi:hypothetical protein
VVVSSSAAESRDPEAWAVARYNDAGALLWEKTGNGLPGDLLAVSSEPWHFVWDAPSGGPVINRHAVTDGTFAGQSLPPDLLAHEPVAYWSDHIVTVSEAGVLSAYTTDLELAWTAPLAFPTIPGIRRVIPGSDGALYVTLDAWITRIVPK